MGLDLRDGDKVLLDKTINSIHFHFHSQSIYDNIETIFLDIDFDWTLAKTIKRKPMKVYQPLIDFTLQIMIIIKSNILPRLIYL